MVATNNSSGTELELQSPRIPAELFRQVISCLDDRPTLVALALTCHFLLADARRQLYDTLTPYAPKPKPPHHKRTPRAIPLRLQHLALLRTLGTYPPLGALVRFYHSSELVAPREPPLWGLLHSALRQMPNLKALRFRAVAGAPCAAELLLGCPFRLEYLHWGCHSDGAGMGRVLEEQGAVRYLHLEMAARAVYPPCSELRMLEGNGPTLETLLPGRSVTAVRWVPMLGDSTTAPVDRGVAAALGRVRKLSFGGYFARPHLDKIVDYLLSLEDLELFTYEFDELALLERLPNLRKLVLSEGRARVDILPSGPMRGSVMHGLFEMCPLVMTIDIMHDSMKASEIHYQRWTRFSAIPLTTLLPMVEVRSSVFDELDF